MTDDLYERYKEALRVGHVAVLRGSLSAAVDAYRTAAEIAPSRALPHTSLGGVLLRLGKLDEALVEYASAVARAPQDEGALLGQAEALNNAGRRAEAAVALDRVAEIQAESGRLPEAADTLRRAMEFSPEAGRAERQRGMQQRIRMSAGDHAAEQLLARALRLRDDHAVEPQAPNRPEAVAAPAPVAPAQAAAAPVVEAQVVEPVAPETPAGSEAVETVPQPAAVESPTQVRVEAPAEPERELEPGQPATAERAGEPEPVVAGAVHYRAPAETEPGVQAPTADSLHRWWHEDEVATRAAAESLEDELVESEVPAEEFALEEARPIDVSDERYEAELAGAHAEGGPRDEVPDAPEPVAAQASAPEIEEQAAEEPAEGELVGVMELPGPEAEPEASGDALAAAAETAEAAADAPQLRTLLLDAASAYAREGRFEAALDSAHRLLRSSPSDVDAHLLLVELYITRDWNALAAEKLALLERLAMLSGDEETRKRVCGVATRAFPRDDRLGTLCSEAG